MPVHDVMVHAPGELRPEPPCRHAPEAVQHCRHRALSEVLDEEMHVVVFAVELPEVSSEVAASLPHRIFAAEEHVCIEDFAPVLCHED
jgi:hypothetical protein